MTTFDKTDDSVVVVIGTGAGGGTLCNELAQKGIKVIGLEAGSRQTTATFLLSLIHISEPTRPY